MRTSLSTASAGARASRAARIAPTAARTEPATSTANAEAGRSSAAWIAVALVLSRYAGAEVAKYNACGAIDSPRSAARPASTPSEVVSSSYDATARVPEPAGTPSASAIALRSSRQ